MKHDQPALFDEWQSPIVERHPWWPWVDMTPGCAPRHHRPRDIAPGEHPRHWCTWVVAE